MACAALDSLVLAGACQRPLARCTHATARSSSVAGAPCSRRHPQSLAGCRRRLLPPPAAIRAVEAFDGSFELQPEQKQKLEELLYSELFCQQVVNDCKLPAGTVVEYTGVLFQPAPWTANTTKGMPQDIEEAYYGKEGYTFINVPPVFMFQAKIFQPPRLCAVYRRRA